MTHPVWWRKPDAGGKNRIGWAATSIHSVNRIEIKLKPPTTRAAEGNHVHGLVKSLVRLQKKTPSLQKLAGNATKMYALKLRVAVA